MPRSFLIKKARSADRGVLPDIVCGPAPVGLDLRPPSAYDLSLKETPSSFALPSTTGAYSHATTGIEDYGPPLVGRREPTAAATDDADDGDDRESLAAVPRPLGQASPGPRLLGAPTVQHMARASYSADEGRPAADEQQADGAGCAGERVRTEPVFGALAPYTPVSIEPLAVRLANGYIHDMYAPSRLYPSSLPLAKEHLGHVTRDHLGHVTHDLREADLDLYGKTLPRGDDDARSEDSSSIGGTASRDDDQQSTVSMESAEDLRKTTLTPHPNNSSGSPKGTFQKGITVAYTYDAFFITDGRSRRRNHLGLAIPDQSRPKYTCNECGKQYATSSNLSRHKQTHRSLDSSNAKKCPHCDKVYVSMPALSMHILTHDLKHQCPVCGKAFSRPWLLQGHIRSHSGEKPYGCAHCGKAFADRSNLRAHMQTHSSFKHYKCKRCDKTFALKSYLNKHYESACLRDTSSNASSTYNSPPSSPDVIIDVQH